MIPGQNMVLGAAAATPNGTAPRCEHLNGLAPVEPQSDGCRDCQRLQARQASLVVCLTCGWVACGNDSPSQHAKAHYAETDHPLARGLPPGSRRTWCYVHQRFV